MGNPTPEDVIKLKAALQVLGYYGNHQAARFEIAGEPFGPFAGVTFFDEFKAFQKNQGLKVDGIVTCDGPTHRRMGELLGA